MSLRRTRPGIVSIFVIAVFCVFIIVPLYWVLITSIKPSDDYLANPPVWFPAHPTAFDPTRGRQHHR